MRYNVNVMRDVVNIFFFLLNEAMRACQLNEKLTRGSSLPRGRDVTLRNGVGNRWKYCAGGISVLREC